MIGKTGRGFFRFQFLLQTSVVSPAPASWGSLASAWELDAALYALQAEGLDVPQGRAQAVHWALELARAPGAVCPEAVVLDGPAACEELVQGVPAGCEELVQGDPAGCEELVQGVPVGCGVLVQGGRVGCEALVRDGRVGCEAPAQGDPAGCEELVRGGRVGRVPVATRWDAFLSRHEVRRHPVAEPEGCVAEAPLRDERRDRLPAAC
jgi:hypothetical protein